VALDIRQLINPEVTGFKFCLRDKRKRRSDWVEHRSATKIKILCCQQQKRPSSV
jgi:hypothetical protein